MSRNPMVVRTVPALRRALDGLRARKATVALVPTMGALHDGHMSLVRLAKRRAAKVVVSIFVNPAQFAPTEDFGSYPRTWTADVAKLAAENVELIWHPDVKNMYPKRFATKIVPEGPAITGLEDRFRPHFFGGVATVVGKLFTQVRPDVAIFGEKDFQQLRVVTQMALDLDLGVKVIGSRTVRERDGLAMSSRNVYLSPDERRVAPTLHKAMKEAAAQIRAGGDVETAMAAGRAMIEDAGFVLDYLEVRHAETLEPIAAPKDGPMRMLVGKARRHAADRQYRGLIQPGGLHSGFRRRMIATGLVPGNGLLCRSVLSPLCWSPLPRWALPRRRPRLARPSAASARRRMP
jgi:pantoate--beta-alanine ligase